MIFYCYNYLTWKYLSSNKRVNIFKYMYLIYDKRISLKTNKKWYKIRKSPSWITESKIAKQLVTTRKQLAIHITTIFRSNIKELRAFFIRQEGLVILTKGYESLFSASLDYFSCIFFVTTTVKFISECCRSFFGEGRHK